MVDFFRKSSRKVCTFHAHCQDDQIPAKIQPMGILVISSWELHFALCPQCQQRWWWQAQSFALVPVVEYCSSASVDLHAAPVEVVGYTVLVPAVVVFQRHVVDYFAPAPVHARRGTESLEAAQHHDSTVYDTNKLYEAVPVDHQGHLAARSAL